jgi:vacuolar-type H+-ATPase subunit I/STV1
VACRNDSGLLGEIDDFEALNDQMLPEITQLGSDRRDAAKSLERRESDLKRDLDGLDHNLSALASATTDLNATLRQLGMLELQAEYFVIAGWVEDEHFEPIRAKITLTGVGASEGESVYPDESGRFIISNARPDVEYLLTAEAAGHDVWRSEAIKFRTPVLSA